MFGTKQKIITDRKRIEEILDRGIVVQILPTKEEFLERLLSGQKLRIYIGADPTSNSLHLSHAKNYMFLEDLRQLGHEVIVLVGDFTARIGDPSDRSGARKQLAEDEIKKNVKDWISQIRPLMDFDAKENPPRILYNSAWLAGMTLGDLIPLAANFTVQRMVERDMFQERIKHDIPIYLNEFLYPLMQGYDSVAMDVDVELCGTDQIFNALAGRTLMRKLKNKDKFVVAVNLMANPKTGELMSKSKGTGVFLSSPPNEMYGAIMAQPDEMIEILFVNCTRIPLSEKDGILALGPRKAKARIALEIVNKFYGEEEAEKAATEFNSVFSKGELPEDIQEFSGEGKSILDFMADNNLAESRSEGKRLLEQKAVKINSATVTDWGQTLSVGDVVQVGPRKFAKVK